MVTMAAWLKADAPKLNLSEVVVVACNVPEAAVPGCRVTVMPLVGVALVVVDNADSPPEFTVVAAK
jgi:hypothetical protein